MTAKHSAATTGTPMTDAIVDASVMCPDNNEVCQSDYTKLSYHARKLERALALAREALQFLHSEVSALDSYTVTSNVDRHKAEACFDAAMDQARTALRAIAQLENEGKEIERG